MRIPTCHSTPYYATALAPQLQLGATASMPPFLLLCHCQQLDSCHFVPNACRLCLCCVSVSWAAGTSAALCVPAAVEEAKRQLPQHLGSAPQQARACAQPSGLVIHAASVCTRVYTCLCSWVNTTRMFWQAFVLQTCILMPIPSWWCARQLRYTYIDLLH